MVAIFTIPLKYKKDYKNVINGKYSETSIEYKEKVLSYWDIKDDGKIYAHFSNQNLPFQDIIAPYSFTDNKLIFIENNDTTIYDVLELSKSKFTLYFLRRIGYEKKTGIDADNDASGWQPGFGNAGQCS